MAKTDTSERWFEARVVRGLTGVPQPEYSRALAPTDFAATHNAAAAAVSLGIAWMHGDVQEQGGPTPVEAWSTMEVIKIRATPRD